MYCAAGIVFEAYAPIGSPGRMNKDDSDPVVLDNPVIKEIAEKHNATPAQVCHHYNYRNYQKTDFTHCSALIQ